MGLVMSLCDRVAVFDAGQVIAEGPPQMVSRDEKVIAAYLGDARAFATSPEGDQTDAGQ
jgi:branched-chain amino acid transport system ATP-binding protein